MSNPINPRPVDPETEAEFPRRVLERVDEWFDNRFPTGRVDAIAAGDHRFAADPVTTVFAAELHQLRRAGELATVVTRGGHIYQRVRIQAVHRHHAVLASDTYPGVLLPLRFIEAVHRLAPPTRQE
ncbi:hypothetical protein ACFYT3_35090 [Nocardia amikacinitolerans]|uniref:hypothetical protein n=1 Tax=Nocardia amikacinitolerans TaxID=756689 RepID=UPI0036837F48